MYFYKKIIYYNNGDYMNMFFLCLKIFIARIIDVSLGTFRTVNTVKGKNVSSSIIGFFEILIWFFVVREALNTDVNNILIAISYALGFSTGTYIGGIISDRFIRGRYSVQIVTTKAFPDMIDALRKENFAVSMMDITGFNNKEIKNMLFIEIDKKDFYKLQKIVKSYDKKAFIVANESKYVINGYFNNDNK